MQESLVRRSLGVVAAALKADPGVRNVYLGGSCASGSDDAVSDIDLWVESDDWSPEALAGLLIAGRTHKIGGMNLFHGVDRDGTVVDIMVGQTPWPNYVRLESEPVAHRAEGSLLAADLFTDFWINSYKHRKPLYRNLDAMVCFGLHHDRMFLLRAWVQADIGADPGEGAFTIHGMTPLVRDHVQGNGHREALLGVSAESRKEKLDAILRYREEMLTMTAESNALITLVLVDPVFNGLLAQCGTRSPGESESGQSWESSLNMA